MPLTFYQGDITTLKVDAIVNAANVDLLMGGGVCGAIFKAAGENELQKACDLLSPIQTGEAVITSGFNLPAKHIIHTAGPRYMNGEQNEEALLRAAYKNSLKVALENGLQSIAFPLISSGIYGYPKDEALRVAVNAIKNFLEKEDLDVRLVIFDKEQFVIDQALQNEVKDYLDDALKEEQEKKWLDLIKNDLERPFSSKNVYYSIDPPIDFQRALERLSELTDSKKEVVDKDDDEKPLKKSLDESDKPRIYEKRRLNYPFPRRIKAKSQETVADEKSIEVSNEEVKENTQIDAEKLLPLVCFSLSPSDFYKENELASILERLDDSFSSKVIQLIKAKGKKEVEVYKKANLDRKLFSKIRSTKHYVPKKTTCLALAVALELNLEETQTLLKSAGFSFSNSRKFDVIVEYFIKKGLYDIFEINQVLFKYDQPLLGV